MKELKTPYLNLKDVHLPMTPTDQVATRAAEYRAAGTTLTAAGTIYFAKDDDADIRSKFEYVIAAGIPIIVGSPTREVLPRVEKFVKEYDIKLAIHNHGTEDKQWPSPLDVLAAVKSMDPRIGCCIDVGHTMRTGTDPVAAIKKVGPSSLSTFTSRIWPTAKCKESQVAVGDGVMPIPGIFKALVDIGYKGNVDLEYEIHDDDPMPGVIKSFRLHARRHRRHGPQSLINDAQHERQRGCGPTASSLLYSSTLRKRRAFAITETELKLIAAAATIGFNSNPNNGYSTPAASGTPRRVIDEREEQILPDILHRPLAQSSRSQQATQITAHQRNPTRCHRNIGSRPHRNAHLRGRQRRSIIHSIARHRHHPPLSADVELPLPCPQEKPPPQTRCPALPQQQPPSCGYHL